MKRHIFKPFIFIAIVAALAAVIMLLWNAIIPSVIGWSALSYLQAAGLLVLSRLLFGSWGGIRERVALSSNKDHRKIREQLAGMTRAQQMEYIRARMSETKNVE